MLEQIEYAFKSMKSSLGLRPMAYHLLHIIEYRLRQKGDHRSWGTIRNVLKTHERLTIGYKVKERLTIGYKVKDDDGAVKQQYIRISSRPEPEHIEIYRKLGLSGRPISRKKLVKNQ